MPSANYVKIVLSKNDHKKYKKLAQKKKLSFSALVRLALSKLEK